MQAGPLLVLAQVLLTALLSGLFSGAIIFALNERRDRNAHQLAKIELTIEAYARWIDEVSEWPKAHYAMFLQDRVAGRQKVVDVWQSAQKHLLTAKVLQEIYLPDRSDSFSIVVDAYRDFIQFGADLQVNSVKGDQLSPDHAMVVSKTGVAIVNAGSVGRKLLVEAARQRAHAPFLIWLPQFRRKT